MRKVSKSIIKNDPENEGVLFPFPSVTVNSGASIQKTPVQG